MIEPSLIKELRINLRLFHGYKAADVRKMTDQQVLSAYKEAIKDVRIEGCNWAESSKAADQFHANHLKNTFHTK
jgi:hypothetical protein